MAKTKIEEITIVGLGLLGASLASVLRFKNRDIKINGVSSSAALNKALTDHIIDKAYPYRKLSDSVKTAQVLFLCTPITHIISTLEQWAQEPPLFSRQCIVTDVGSTKLQICQLGSRIFSSIAKGIFIGSHPMAGSEQSGYDALDIRLFENASWILCPDQQAPPAAVSQLKDLVKLTGAHSTIMTPELHDKVVGHVSHLPQLLSSALAGFISEQHNVVDHCLEAAGGGFRDMTRLAGSSPQVWEPIFATNQDQVMETLTGYISYLQKVKKDFAKGSFMGLLKKGLKLRQDLARRKSEYTSGFTEVLMQIPDKPGILESIFRPLAKSNINIIDVDILNVREGEAGTLLLAFKTCLDAESALGILIKQGFKARIR
jgi:prephenate dehydrogenase